MYITDTRIKILNLINNYDTIKSKKELIKLCEKHKIIQGRTAFEHIKYLDKIGLVTIQKRRVNALIPNRMNPDRKQKMFDVIAERIQKINKDIREISRLFGHKLSKKRRNDLLERSEKTGLLINTTLDVLNSLESDKTRWMDFEDQINDLKNNYQRLGSRLFLQLGKINQSIARQVLERLTVH